LRLALPALLCHEAKKVQSVIIHQSYGQIQPADAIAYFTVVLNDTAKSQLNSKKIGPVALGSLLHSSMSNWYLAQILKVSIDA
jgi:hypothetical protein